MVELGPFVHQPCRIADGATRCDRGRSPRYAEKATGIEPNVVEGRFMIHVRHLQSAWIVIVEPDTEARLLVVVTVYGVSE